MADTHNSGATGDAPIDVDMAEQVAVEVEIPNADGNADEEGGEGNNGEALPFPDGNEAMDSESSSPRVTFVDYLKSPVISLLVGQGDQQALLTAHQRLLTTSPWFAEACGKFSESVSERRIDLVDEELDAVGAFLEFLYTGDYFPRKIVGTRDLEQDGSFPEVDETGDQLLRHARVYTLGAMLQLPALKSLATSKIHCVNSTAKGELAYARYIYAHTDKNDQAIRHPVANFWATRSHVLRSEAEDEFREMCLQYPEFGYDVLTRVLDEKLKREKTDKLHPSAPGSSRKRARVSVL